MGKSIPSSKQTGTSPDIVSARPECKFRQGKGRWEEAGVEPRV